MFAENFVEKMAYGVGRIRVAVNKYSACVFEHSAEAAHPFMQKTGIFLPRLPLVAKCECSQAISGPEAV
jgi:hypothetical protein